MDVSCGRGGGETRATLKIVRDGLRGFGAGVEPREGEWLDGR
jgi:hypothetical protein